RIHRHVAAPAGTQDRPGAAEEAREHPPMSQDTDITEVSDPRQLTIDNPPDTSTPEIQVLKGQPTDDELAALVAVISAAAGHTPDPGPQELNMWGHPVDKLRYHIASWQRVTLLEDRKSTRLNSNHVKISYAVFCLKKKKKENIQ